MIPIVTWTPTDGRKYIKKDADSEDQARILAAGQLAVAIPQIDDALWSELMDIDGRQFYYVIRIDDYGLYMQFRETAAGRELPEIPDIMNTAHRM
ncbi:hypothetical protein [Nisaea denitrificans]|uniref:hypothetical protein n=1 Tax=Nisaea denitrificans TaxID=390877 RepID=UPI00048E0B29|nr:hypothetical protein [Nisaea denitrificans]